MSGLDTKQWFQEHKNINWEKWMKDHHIKLKGCDVHDSKPNAGSHSGRIRRTLLEN